MSVHRFRKRAGADAVTLAVSRRPVSRHLPTALRIFVRGRLD